MAGFQMHISTSTAVGAAYGMVGIWHWHLDWGPVFLGAGLTSLGGILPDLDSDSGIPVRELFGVAAAFVPFLVYRRLLSADFSAEQTLVLLGCMYLFIRYALSRIFQKFTVHRGMFHSIPAMVIAGMAVFLGYESPNLSIRIFLAVGTMFGFLSHLLLDEIYSVDFMGIAISLNKYAGSALKFYSPSWKANIFCYLILFGLGYVCYWENKTEIHQMATGIREELSKRGIWPST